MSLILEALRKSEAERRRGQVPNLHAERAPAALRARAARPAWPWLALATVAVVALAWLARGVWSPPSHVVDTPTGRVGPSSVAALAAGPRSGLVSSDVAAASPVDGAAPAPPASAGLAGTLPSPRAANIAATAAREPMSIPAPRADAGAAPTNGPRAVAASIATPLPPAAVAPVASLARQPAARAPAITSAVTPPAPALTAATAAAPLRLADLSAAERLELPPLKMSMHMWDPTPTQRFAIIDGARVSEGDRLGDAVVDEITASAVVLAWRGQRLQIPLR